MLKMDILTIGGHIFKKLKVLILPVQSGATMIIDIYILTIIKSQQVNVIIVLQKQGALLFVVFPDSLLAGGTHILSKEVRSLARREVVPKPLWRQGFWTRSEREYECQDPPTRPSSYPLCFSQKCAIMAPWLIQSAKKHPKTPNAAPLPGQPKRLSPSTSSPVAFGGKLAPY